MLCENNTEILLSAWSNYFPQIPHCFTLVIVPLTLSICTTIATVPYLLCFCYKRSLHRRNVSLLFIFQLIFICAAAINSVTQIGLSTAWYIPLLHTAFYMPCASVLVLIFLLVIWNIERLYDAKNSAICFFILLSTICAFGLRCWNHLFLFIQSKDMINMTDVVWKNTSSSTLIDPNVYPWNSDMASITDFISFILFIVLFILSCQSERMINYKAKINRMMLAKQEKPKTNTGCVKVKDPIRTTFEHESNQLPSPEGHASFLSRLVYAWFTNLIVRGYRHPLEIDDLWRLDEHHCADRVSARLARRLTYHVQAEKAVNYYMEKRRISLLQANANNVTGQYKVTRPGYRPYRSSYNASSTEDHGEDDSFLRRASDGNWLQSPQYHLNKDTNTVSSPDLVAAIQVSVVDDDDATQQISSEVNEDGYPRSVHKHSSLSAPVQLRDDLSRMDSKSSDFPGYIEYPNVVIKGSREVLPRRSVRLDVYDQHKAYQDQRSNNSKPNDTSLDKERIDMEKGKGLAPKRRGCCVGFVSALIATYWAPMVWTAFLKLTQDILTFVNPLLLKLLLNFMQAEHPEPVWHGYVYAALMFIVAGVQTLVLQRYFKEVNVIGMHIRTAVTAAVYKKSLRLSNMARQESTTGQIMNLISSDALHFVQLMPYINIIWSGPFQIIVAIVLLWHELGPAVLAGVGVLLLLLPLNAFVAKISKTVQEKKFKAADSRIKMISEILNGIRVIKLYAWEPSFAREVGQLRETEMKYLRKYTYLHSISFLWSSAPFLVALSSFGLYILLSDQNNLDAQKAFVSLSLFNILRFPLFMFPMITSSLVQSYVSCRRLDKFLRHTEINPDNRLHEDTPGVAAVVERGVFGWDPKEDPILHNISLHFPDGQLTLVMGTVGSGKSSLLSALLGEMECFNGRVNIKGSVAYVPQEPWIFNGTLRENILFLKPYDPVRYRKVIEVCCLAPDLRILPDGDQTEIGDKGINLSGGQKQRVSLARACYADADIYLLDDPLSAVDAHVGLHILNHVLSRSTGFLSSKTCILTTHSPKALPFADRIVLLSGGQVTDTGTYRQLLHSRTGKLAEFITSVGHIERDKDTGTANNSNKHLVDHTAEKSMIKAVPRTPSVRSHTSGGQRRAGKGRTTSNSSDRIPADVLFESTLSLTDVNNNGDHNSEGEENAESRKSDKVVQRQGKTEAIQTGRVKWSVFKTYIRNIGIYYSILILLSYPATHLASLGTNLWLAAWSEDAKLYPNATNASADTMHARRDYRLGVYAGIGFAQVLTAWVSVIAFALGHLICAQKLHDLLLNGILRAPAGFFDLVPQGRVVNRFAQDIATLDGPLLVTMKSALTCLLHCFLTLCVTASVNPWILIPITLLTTLYLTLQNVYVANSRQLKRIESAYRSPVFSHFSETLLGMSNIRAYGMTDQYVRINANRLDTSNSASYASMIAQRWLAVLLEFIGNFIVLCVGMFCVATRGQLSAGLSGLVLSYALNLNQSLNWLVRMSADLENDIVCVERIEEYANIEPEAPWELADQRPPSSWPIGEIEFDHFGLRYRPELDLVLHSISFKVKPGERIGIVGRTGSGKSSLVMGLFRMLEAAEGRILIDGVDIAKIGLHDLRIKLTLIPQDPVLFSGTLRFNLDPFEQHSDEAIWECLELANLKNYVKENSNNLGLDMVISEGGGNISMGQRQLVCLARALLRRSSILVLDEATAAVDPITDNLIQETIRKQFNHCTVLTIAHRLNTILDYDRIILLQAGRILETGSPSELLEDKNSNFYSLASDANLVDRS